MQKKYVELKYGEHLQILQKEKGIFLNFVETEGILNMHHWLGVWTPLPRLGLRGMQRVMGNLANWMSASTSKTPINLVRHQQQLANSDIVVDKG